MSREPRNIHLVRHGESQWNRERRVQGNCRGIALSEKGIEQARLLGQRLKRMHFDSVHCSSVERAVQTARIALGDDREIAFSEELREISFGDWEGKLVSEIGIEAPGEIENWFRKPSSVSINGAERYLDFHGRAVSAIGGIIDSTEGDVLIICHGGVICTWLTHILNMDPDDLWAFSLPNASITTVKLEFRPRLRLLGDSSHLTPDILGFDGMPSVSP